MAKHCGYCGSKVDLYVEITDGITPEEISLARSAAHLARGGDDLETLFLNLKSQRPKYDHVHCLPCFTKRVDHDSSRR